jgi:hypothetical protein
LNELMQVVVLAAFPPDVAKVLRVVHDSGVELSEYVWLLGTHSATVRRVSNISATYASQRLCEDVDILAVV